MKTNRHFEDILTEAHGAAERAVQDMGPENMNAMDCGFAWVTISGNEPLARYCRGVVADAEKNAGHMAPGETTRVRRRYGSKDYSKGWQWWNPGGFAGQAIGHKEAGARAFRDVMARHNIRVDVGSRYD